MNAIRLLMLAAGLGPPLFAQDGTLICSPGPNHGSFSYETHLEPSAPPLASNISSGLLCTDFGAHRSMTDPSQRKYFGYDINLEALPQANTYRVTLRPLSITAKKMGLSDAARDWSMLALPGFPPPQIVHGGDTIALDLFVNPATGQKIVDYIRIREQKRPATEAAPGTARDFSVADAQLRLVEPRISVNGKLAATFSDVAATAIWFYLPRHGRYFLSLVPYPGLGFQRAGEVRGNSLRFTTGTDTVTLECSDRIAGRAPYNLYVRYDAAWHPKGEAARTANLMAAEDDVESILRP